MVKTKSRKKTKNKQGKQNQQKSAQAPLSLKERLAQKRQIQETRKKIFSLIGSCLGMTLVIGLPLGLVVDPKLGIAVSFGLPLLLFCYQYSRLALWFFLIYMPFSGTVIYWLAGGSALFQLAKDIFYIPALLALVQECKRKRKPIFVPPKLMPTLAMMFGWCMMTILFVNIPLQLSGEEPGSPLLQGILGLKILLGYVPLIFCTYYLIEDKKTLFWLGRLMLILAITCCCLSLVQYWMLDTGRCQGTRDAVGDALFKASLDAKCFVGGALTFSPSQGQIRLPGTFVSPWHWAWFLISNSVTTFTTAFCDPSPLWRIGGLFGMAIVFINAVICGQRIALLLVPVLTILLLILTGQITNLKRFIPIGAGLAILLSILLISNPEIVQERVASLQGRWQASPPQAFIQEQFDWALHQAKGLFGGGLGKATNSARTFGSTVLIETFHPKLIYEIGITGTILFMIFVSHLTLLTFQAYRSVKDKTLRNFGSSLWVFILIITYFPYWYPLDTDPVAVYYWLFAGIIFKLPQLEQQEEAKIKAEIAGESGEPIKNKRNWKFSKREQVA